MSTTINKEEIQKFSRLADEWWDVNGKFKPLNKKLLIIGTCERLWNQVGLNPSFGAVIAVFITTSPSIFFPAFIAPAIPIIPPQS